LQILEEVGKTWSEALALAGKGEFSLALEGARRAKRLLPSSPHLTQLEEDLVLRQQNFARSLGRLREGVEQEKWGEVVEAAEQVLTLAPHHAEAHKVRGQAWQSLISQQDTISFVREHSGTNSVPRSEPGCDRLPTRFLLWIDGVGGYLLCLGNRLTFGQAGFDTHQVDVPLVADISRLHATLTRDAEGYVVEGPHPIQVNGKETRRALLRPGDRVTLGTSCQFLFQLPVPVSSTARLDLVSGHRLPLSVEGVVLMADTLVLGPGPQAHVVVPDLQTPLVLFRYQNGLGVRHNQALTVNGQPTGTRGLLGQQAHVQGETISFALEPVGVRMGY
jgi:hypothetical protein